MGAREELETGTPYVLCISVGDIICHGRIRPKITHGIYMHARLQLVYTVKVRLNLSRVLAERVGVVLTGEQDEWGLPQVKNHGGKHEYVENKQEQTNIKSRKRGEQT